MLKVKVPHLGLRMVRERTIVLPGQWVTNASQASSIAAHLIGKLPTERLIAILVNARGQVTGVTTISQGGMSGVGVRASDVLRAVLCAHASGFVLAHNHPSGDPTPSHEDIAFTAKVKQAATAVDLALLDHIIVVADGSYQSIRDDSDEG